MDRIIAVDCDEVLVETMKDVIAYSKKHNSYGREYNDIRHYLISDNDHIDIALQQALDLFDAYFISEDAKHVQPILGAKEKLLEWQKQGYTLVVVTARSDIAKFITRYQIDTYYPGIFSDIIFAHHYTELHVPKSQLCKEIGAKVLVEDNINYALEVAQHGIHSILLNKPWNILRTETDPHLIRVSDWDEINPLFPQTVFVQ